MALHTIASVPQFVQHEFPLLQNKISCVVIRARLLCDPAVPCAPHPHAGAKVEPKAVATLLPNIKEREAGAEVFRIMSNTLHDDKGAFEFLCPQQVRLRPQQQLR